MVVKYDYTDCMDTVSEAKSIVVWLKKNKDEFGDIPTQDGLRHVSGVGVRPSEFGYFGKVVVWGTTPKAGNDFRFVAEVVHVSNNELRWAKIKNFDTREEREEFLRGTLKVATEKL